MKNKNLYRILLWISFFLAAGVIVSLVFKLTSFTGPLLILFFLILAFGVRGNNFLRGFSYTIMIFTAVTIAMFYPDIFRSWGKFELKILIVPLLQIIMFGMGSQMSFRDFAAVVKMPKGVILGLVCQFTIMPFVGYIIATSFGFPPEIAAGIILVGASPSGLASNVMSFIAKANLALSVSLTAFATMLAPIITPLMMKWLAGQFVPINFWAMMIGIINIVILPIIAGLIFNSVAYGKDGRKSTLIQLAVYLTVIVLKNFILYSTGDEELANVVLQLGKDIFWFLLLPLIAAYIFKAIMQGKNDFMDRILAFFSMAGIGIIIAIITAAGRDSLLDIGVILIFASLLHNVTGYFLGYWICRFARMDEKSCRTIALEVGMQNGGLASGIALQMGKVATVGLAPAVFGPLMNITGSSLATWWRGKPVKDPDIEQHVEKITV